MTYLGYNEEFATNTLDEQEMKLMEQPKMIFELRSGLNKEMGGRSAKMLVGPVVVWKRVASIQNEQKTVQ